MSSATIYPPCGFSMSYVGYCKNPQPCPKHAGLYCSVCDKAATRDCDYVSQFMCGIPLCDTCIPFTEPDRYGHTHKSTIKQDNAIHAAADRALRALALEEDKIIVSSPEKKKYGWLCTRCGASYAPHVDECKRCNCQVWSGKDARNA